MSVERGVIVDTCIWSLSLRRRFSEAPESDYLTVLIAQRRVKMLGAIRQEILSGIRHPEQFSKLEAYLRAFPDLVLNEADYETAAHFSNICRRQGIQGSSTDFLICSVASQRNLLIFTTDKDFENFQNFLPIEII